MRCLPFEHAILNIGRRPLRSLLTAMAAALVAALFVGTAAFVRGMETSHLSTAPPNTAILLSSSAMRDILRSSVSPAVAEFVAADVPGILRMGGQPASSAEIHMGTDIGVDTRAGTFPGFVRGVTERAYLVHDKVTLIEGALPGPGEALVGRLAAAQSGLEVTDLAPGRTLAIEGGTFRISGTFAAPGTTLEAEIWLPLAELQGHANRDDCSVVFVRTRSAEDLADVELFAIRRLDLELALVHASAYYEDAASYLAPIRTLAWVMAVLIGLAALLSGANTLQASVQDRGPELASLLAIGFRGRALAWMLLQEALVLGAAGAVVGVLLAKFGLARATMSIAMTAFRFEVDAWSTLIGLAAVLTVVVAGTLPALLSVLSLPIARALKED